MYIVQFQDPARGPDKIFGSRVEQTFDLLMREPMGPPANKPTRGEIASCREYLAREWALLPELRAVLALGRVALDGFVALLRETGRVPPRKHFAFGHGVSHDLGAGLALFASYHPSQQNTFTGRLTSRTFDAVMNDIDRHLRGSSPPSAPRKASH